MVQVPHFHDHCATCKIHLCDKISWLLQKNCIMISVGLFCQLYRVSSNVLEENKGFGFFFFKKGIL
jgi:hypothetical protein